jgi:A/G-specific adenine glycosylase
MVDQSRVFVRKLLIWYKKAARNLPWRETRNPYAVLVSEFMLQQTQVSRVLEYFPRFMARFPTIESLAHARPKAVMEEWDGLGYYARARNLHALARVVSKTQGGRLSSKPEELQELPGVGRYTVDTHVQRVLGRVFAKKDVWKLARTLLPRNGKTAWKFNQALMELGALVCTARKPKCSACPVKHGCRYTARLNSQTRSPARGRPG